jgi:GR25 family glycosyltransferase involved in LPS biosynthesis
MFHKTVALFFLLVTSLFSLDFRYLKEVPPKYQPPQIRNIDFIYMINLDQRPEKFELSLENLRPYGIVPYRFSAVNGWELSLLDLEALATPYEPRMGKGHWGSSYLVANGGEVAHEIMQVPGKPYYCHCMSRGAVGIVLSHLSILKDAFDSGYETIWVMEDDVEVISDPHELAEYIDELDRLVGKKGWDILFTDPDTKGQDGKYVACTSYAWRPDMPAIDLKRFSKKQKISSDFTKVGARYGAYSMIVRRSGMRKILNFFATRQVFLPFDMEFTLPEQSRLFSLTKDVVSTQPRASSDNGSPGYLNRKGL